MKCKSNTTDIWGSSNIEETISVSNHKHRSNILGSILIFTNRKRLYQFQYHVAYIIHSRDMIIKYVPVASIPNTLDIKTRQIQQSVNFHSPNIKIFLHSWFLLGKNQDMLLARAVLTTRAKVQETNRWFIVSSSTIHKQQWLGPIHPRWHKLSQVLIKLPTQIQLKHLILSGIFKIHSCLNYQPNSSPPNLLAIKS